MLWLNILLIVISIFLTIAILLQQRGSGLSSSFGGGGSSYHTKRGLERILFIASIVLAVLFIGGTLLRLLI